jgi:hypothetical protein
MNPAKGAVYTCDFAYELTYDYMYDFLQKVICNLIFYRFFLIFVDK